MSRPEANCERLALRRARGGAAQVPSTAMNVPSSLTKLQIDEIPNVSGIHTKLSDVTETNKVEMLTWDETVEDESCGNDGTGSQFSSDSELMLELNKLMDNENRTQDYILGSWIIAPSRYLSDFQPARRVGLPLVMCSKTNECSNKLFLDIFSGRHHRHQGMITVTNITDLSDKYLVYSNDGWLLFRRPSSTGFGESLFLHHVVAGHHIDLPDIRGPCRSRTYLFSTSSSSSTSSVDYVVNVTRHSHTRRTTIYVTRPDTRSWEVYTKQRGCGPCHKFAFSGDCEMVAGIIVGKKVYVFDHSEIVDVFDLVERRWWSVTVPGFHRRMSDYHVAESDGKIVKIYSQEEDLNRYRFFSLEWDDEEYRASWVEMSECELENKSWFLGDLMSRTCCMKNCKENGGQATVYRFTRKIISFTAGAALNIEVHDLKAGTTSSVLPFAVFSNAMYGWVDLGYSSKSRV